MPIEIREIIIKTEITLSERNSIAGIKEKELNLFRKQVLEECKRMISENTRKDKYKR